MVRSSVKLKPDHSRKVRKLIRQMGPRMHRGLTNAGAVVEGSWRNKISGTGYTRNPGRAKPYPGVYRGEYFRTLTSRVKGQAAVIGPKVDYAAYHETGTKHIPARPVIPDTIKDSRAKVIHVFTKEVMKGV